MVVASAPLLLVLSAAPMRCSGDSEATRALSDRRAGRLGHVLVQFGPRSIGPAGKIGPLAGADRGLRTDPGRTEAGFNRGEPALDIG
jgi:hypothetical protein